MELYELTEEMIGETERNGEGGRLEVEFLKIYVGKVEVLLALGRVR